MNYVDILIVLALIASFAAGYKSGFLKSIFSVIGNIGGAIAGLLQQGQSGLQGAPAVQGRADWLFTPLCHSAEMLQLLHVHVDLVYPALLAHHFVVPVALALVAPQRQIGQ